MRYISLVMAVLAIGFGIPPGLFVKERYYHAASKQAKERLLPAMKQTLSDQAVSHARGHPALQHDWVGDCQRPELLHECLRCVPGRHRAGDKDPGSHRHLLFLPSMFCVPALTWIATRFGKRALLYPGARLRHHRLPLHVYLLHARPSVVAGDPAAHHFPHRDGNMAHSSL